MNILKSLLSVNSIDILASFFLSREANFMNMSSRPVTPNDTITPLSVNGEDYFLLGPLPTKLIRCIQFYLQLRGIIFLGIYRSYRVGRKYDPTGWCRNNNMVLDPTGWGRNMVLQDGAEIWSYRVGPKYDPKGWCRNMVLQGGIEIWSYRVEPKCDPTGWGENMILEGGAELWSYRVGSKYDPTGWGRYLIYQFYWFLIIFF